jgi:choline dehydrogenase
MIHAGYFTDERDLTTLAQGAIECVKLANKMGYDHTKIVRQTIGKGASGKGNAIDLYDLESWKERCRQMAATLYHPSSTCAMGKVVDSNLKVKGISGLRVADASVFPHLTSGNTNAPAIMVGEMASDIIKKEYQHR